MASDAILQRLQAEFDSPPEALQTLVGLLSEGAPVPYVHRHCRERVPGMTEDRMHAVEERLHQLEETEQRKDAIRQQAEGRGSLTEDLKKTLDESFDQDLLDDIYQSMRPRRRTPAMVAEEQGLGPLAQAVQHRQLGDKSLVDVAAEYVDAEKGLETTERVLEGVALILAERFASDPDVRDTFRRELSKGILKASAVQPGRRGAQRYKQFFDMSEPVRRVAPQRMLALRRAEREGVLKVELCLPEGREKEILRERFASDVEAGSVLAEFLDVVFQTAYDAHLRKACERDIRRRIKERADRETVRHTVRTLRSLLMAPPLGGKKVLSLRATSMTLWAALVEEDGGMAEGKTITLGIQEPRKARPKKPRKPKAEEKPAEREAPAENAEAAATGEASAETSDAPAAEAPAAEAADTPAEAPAETPAESSSEPPAEASAEPTPDEAPAPAEEPAEAPTEEPAEAAPADAEATTEAPAAEGAETEAPAESGEAAESASEGTAEDTPSEETPEPEAPAMSEEERKAKNESLRSAGIEWIKEVVENQSPAAIAIPHGRRQSVTERLVTPVLKQLPAENRPMLIPVDEAASHIYATSGAGRKRDQRVEVGVRTAASLARRLQDPLQELLKMDNRNLGLGQSLDEVHQGLLQRHLDATVASCLAEIGIDINTAGVDLLQRLPLIDREQAEKIVSFRKKNQGFRSLAQLKEVEGIDDARFRYVAGFFRLLGGEEPLDATAVHPDLYDAAKRMAEARSATIEDLLGKSDLRFRPEDVDENTTEAQARSILKDLAGTGSDPRGEMAIAANEGITSIGQLQNQMELKARVTNLTDFGAFVDVGIGQDGLVHISQIPGKRRSEENALRIGEAVTVWVLGVDLEKRKISLSMFPPRKEGEGRRGGGGRRRPGRFDGERGERQGGGRGRGGRDGGRSGRDGGRGGRDGGRDGGGRGRGGRDGDRRGRPPRVITVESERKLEEAKGHKGEFKSLSGLKALINKDKKSEDQG